MQISISKSKDLQNMYAHKFFETVKCEELETLSNFVLSNVWSPIVWAGGARKTRNFLSCNYLALDFDEGLWSLNDAENWLKQNNIGGIIGTTKSHQLEKKQDSGIVSPPCDRFRLICFFDRKITDHKEYVYNMSQIMQEIPCDKACKDAARAYKPCKSITYLSQGDTYPTIERPAGLDEIAREALIDSQESGLLPASVVNALIHGPPVGERNDTAYLCARKMAECGYSEQDIISQISKKNSLDQVELAKTIKNGVNAARNEVADAIARTKISDEDGWNER